MDEVKRKTERLLEGKVKVGSHREKKRLFRSKVVRQNSGKVNIIAYNFLCSLSLFNHL